MGVQFKAQHGSQSGLWRAKAVKAIDVVQTPPNDLAIQQPDLLLKSLRLNDTGVLYSPRLKEIFLRLSKEIDELYSYGFKSSFMQHHLTNNPNVSAIPSTEGALVEPSNDSHGSTFSDGPKVSFVLRVNCVDTVAAHVDTGATVMVSNVQGEIHGAIPTTAHCGTAMTGSKMSINALGIWMVNLAGSENGKDLPFALRGTTIPMSIHEFACSQRSWFQLLTCPDTKW
jgi:hypothetical protein